MVHASELLRNPVCLEKLSLQLELLFVCCCERNLLDESSGEAWQCSRSLCARYCRYTSGRSVSDSQTSSLAEDPAGAWQTCSALRDPVLPGTKLCEGLHHLYLSKRNAHRRTSDLQSTVYIIACDTRRTAAQRA